MRLRAGRTLRPGDDRRCRAPGDGRRGGVDVTCRDRWDRLDHRARRVAWAGGVGHRGRRVIAVHVAVGDTVAIGDVVAVVEAMKMEHALRAPLDGVVVEVGATPGAAVALEQPLLTIAPPE